MDSRHVFRVKWGSPRDREVRCPENSQLGADLNLRKALFALMKYNWSCSRLLDEVLHQSFGEGEQFSLDSSFFGVVADLLSEGLVQLSIEQLTCLLLSKLSHPDADIRQRAFQLTVSLDSTPAGRLRTAALLPAISSPSANLYRHAQYLLHQTTKNMRWRSSPKVRPGLASSRLLDGKQRSAFCPPGWRDWTSRLTR